MNERIVIEYAPAEGALLRLLGLIERRGFRVCAIDMAELPGGGRAIATLDLAARDGARALETLGLQLRRLHGVIRVGAARQRCIGEAA